MDREGLTSDWLKMTSVYYGGITTHRHNYGFSDMDVGSITQSDSSDDVDEEDEDGPADDFDAAAVLGSNFKPFLYNERMFIISLPGIATLLMLVGEILLIVLTCGAFVIYLLKNADDQGQYLVAYIVTFVCAELTVFYAVLPLIWLSLLNVLLLILVNMFCGLSAAWLLLTIPRFTRNQPQLAQLLESSIFTVSPFVSVCFVTWFLANFTTSVLTAYYFMITGFIVGQWFLTPVTSSFGHRQSNDAYVLGAYTSLAMTLAYCVMPAVILICTSANPLSSAKMMVEFVFIASNTISLATFFNLRLAFEIIAIPYHYVKTTRRLSTFLAMFTLSWVLHDHGVLMAHWLPWLSLGLMLHVVYGTMMLSSQHQKWIVWIGTSTIVMFYVLLFLRLPWSLDYYILNGAVHINAVYVGLMLSISLCIASLYTSVLCSRETSTAFLLAFSLVFITMQQILLTERLYSHSIMAILSICWQYVLLRLHNSDRLPWKPALLMMVLHASCLISNVGRSLPPASQSGSSWLFAAYQFSATSLLMSVLLRICLFEMASAIDNNKLTLYVMSTVTAGLLCALSWLPLLQSVFFMKHLVFAPTAAFTLCAVSVVCAKLDACHHTHVSHLKYLATVAMTTAVCMLYVRPHFMFTWSALFSWLQMTGIVCCVLLRGVKSHMKSQVMRIPMAIVIGCPLGVCSIMLFVTFPTIVEYSAYGLQMSILTDLTLIYWLDQSVKQQRQILIRIFLLLPLPLAIVVSTSVTSAATYWSARLLVAASALFSAVVVKRILYHQQKEHLATFSRPAKSRLPAVCDMLTCVAFVSVCVLWPVGSWQIWVTCCSVILLLLRHPPTAGAISPSAVPSTSYCSQQAFWPSAISTVVLLASTLINCRLSYNNIPTLLHIAAGCVEIIIIASLLPVYHVLLTILYCECFYISDHYVVFITPLASLLFLLGSSYSAWLLALYSLVAGAWLMKYQLPLEVNR